MIEKASVRLGAPASRARDALDVALVIPLQGPAGIFGPSCECCARLAAEEVNAASGVLGREVRLVLVDGGAPPEQVATEVDALISGGVVDAVAGWHISAVREVVAPRIDGRVPYVYTALYEGGERSPGVFLTGETPNRQLRPALRWFASELDIRRWTIVGDDYVWPRSSARAAHRYRANWAARSVTRCMCRWAPRTSGPCSRASRQAAARPC